MRQSTCILALLMAHPLFAGIPEERVASYIDNEMHEITFTKGETVFGAADSAPALGFVVEGSALVYKEGTDGHRVLMSRLACGDAFGMASMFSTGTYPTEIIAEKRCAVLLWERTVAEAAIASDPGLAANYIQLLSQRIHFLGERIGTLVGDDLPTRVLRLLAGMQRDGRIGADNVLPYSLSQLAQMLGVGRASLYRALDLLESRGIVRRAGKQITIEAGDGLAEASGMEPDAQGSMHTI